MQAKPGTSTTQPLAHTVLIWRPLAISRCPLWALGTAMMVSRNSERCLRSSKSSPATTRANPTAAEATAKNPQQRRRFEFSSIITTLPGQSHSLFKRRPHTGTTKRINTMHLSIVRQFDDRYRTQATRKAINGFGVNPGRQDQMFDDYRFCTNVRTREYTCSAVFSIRNPVIRSLKNFV